MAWYTFWKKEEPAKPKLKICCACPETKVRAGVQAHGMGTWCLA